MDNIVRGGLSNIVRDKILEDTAKLIFNGGDKFVPGVNLVISTFDGIKENEKIEAHNNQIDDKLEDLKKTSDDAQIIIDYSIDFCMNMQIKCIDGDFKIERISVDSVALLDKLEKYNTYIYNRDKNQQEDEENQQEDEENQQDNVTIEDMEKYLCNDCDNETQNKVNNYRSY